MSIDNVVITSADRTNQTEDASNCTLTFARVIQGDYYIKSLNITNTFYNVDETNNVIYFYENSTAKTANIPNGFYSASTLATAAANALTTASAGFNTYSCSYNDTTKKYTFTASNTFYFNWSADNNNNGAYEQLGFNKQTNTTSGTSVSSVNVINLSNPLGVFFNVSDCNSNIQLSNGYASGVVYVPINVSYGSIARLELFNYATILKFNSVQNIRVRIIDNKGRTRNTNGGSFVIELIRC
jgi:predicted enzyme related to lactoylglutathione lyase